MNTDTHNALLEEPEPLPAGTPSALVTAAQPPPPRHYRMAAGAATYEYTGSPSVLLLTLASQNLLAHARTLAARTEGEYHQMAVVFAHAACELHTEWAINQLLNERPDKTLVELVLPADRDVTSLETARTRRVYSALTGDDPRTSSWWDAWDESRQASYLFKKRKCKRSGYSFYFCRDTPLIGR
jgi:hypothetical protein